MENEKILTITKYFEPLKDPRMLLKTNHKLIDIIILAICGVIAI